MDLIINVAVVALIVLVVGGGMLYWQEKRRKWAAEGKVQGYDSYTGMISPIGAAQEQQALIKSRKPWLANPEVLIGAIAVTLVGLVYPFLQPVRPWQPAAGSLQSICVGTGFFLLGMVLFYFYYNLRKQIVPIPGKIRWLPLLALFAGLGLLVVPLVSNVASGLGWQYLLFPIGMAILATAGYYWSNRKI